jgi:hypothetical protein
MQCAWLVRVLIRMCSNVHPALAKGDISYHVTYVDAYVDASACMYM